MLALVKYGKGAGETELREVPVPEIGENDLLMEVMAAGICGSDLAYDAGLHPNQLNTPVILGHEFAGRIAKAGSKVKDWKVGDRIVSDNTGYVCGKCFACTTGQFLMCPDRLGMGYGMDGGFTEYVKISGDLLAKNPNAIFAIPDNVSYEEAAILDPICNPYKAIVQESHILPGEDIVIFGVGPIGLFAIQIAKLIGCGEIIAVGRSGNDKRFAMAKEFGATRIIESDKVDVAAEVKKITKGEMAALVVDCAGANELVNLAIDLVRNGGEIVHVGYDARPYNYSLDRLLERGVSIKGHFGYDYQSWKNCIHLLELGKVDLKGMISHYITLTDWKKGFELMRNKEGIKVVFTKDPEKLKNSGVK